MEKVYPVRLGKQLKGRALANIMHLASKGACCKQLLFPFLVEKKKVLIDLVTICVSVRYTKFLLINAS